MSRGTKFKTYVMSRGGRRHPPPPVSRDASNGSVTRNNVDMYGVLRSLQNMQNGKAKMWRKRGGSNRMSMMSNNSQDSSRNFQEPGSIADVEEDFLHAAEFGDIPTVKRLLADNPDLNVDCIDALGRTALRLAVKNEHLEVVEVLLERSSSRHVYEAVLQAISAGHVQIAESILKHKRYLELWKERKKLGDDDHFFKTEFEESQFSPDITPLILASQKNQYEIVQLLLLRGEKINKPHKFGCLCRECVNKMKFDQLRSAKYRLNAYRGLASEAYISLSSKDPILTAFQLSKELKNLSGSEKYFKVEYNELSNQLSEYVVKLLDRVRTQRELELVLNKTGKANEERYSDLARLSLALQYREKKFVAHPSCQQRLDKSWYQGIDTFLKVGHVKRMFMIMLFVVAYPFLTIAYIISPMSNQRFIKILRFPWVKFSVHTCSFVIFLLMIVITTVEATYVLRQNSTLASDYPEIFGIYRNLANMSSDYHYGPDVPIRQNFPTTTQFLITLWIFGFLYHECVQLYNDGLSSYTASLYNLMDFALLFLYMCSFSLKYLVMVKVYLAIHFFQNTGWSDIVTDSNMTQYNLYWITADRYFWLEYDPINISEGLFAIANILSFSRISYLLPALEALGPLQISFGRMMKDVMKCLCLISLVLVAFMVGLQNLYWYYHVRDSIEVVTHTFEVPAQEAFGEVLKTFRTVFWSLFGRGESTVVMLGQYDNYLTEHAGYIIYGTYNIIMVTVLINMLIAMMTRSFQAIAESSDVEWKFSRSQLYMEYISEDEVLPVPFNLARIPRSICEVLFPCCGKDDSDDDYRGMSDDGNFAASAAAQFENGILPHDEPPQPVRKAGGDITSELKRRRTDRTDSHTTSEISAVDMYEANITSRNDSIRGSKANMRSKKRPSLPGFMENNNNYQRVMQRIIQRYIFDIQREAEVTEDDFEEIKQDVSSFRYEVLNVLQRKEQQYADIHSTLSKLHNVITGQPLSQPNTQPNTPTEKKRKIPPKLQHRMSSKASIFSTDSVDEADEVNVNTDGLEHRPMVNGILHHYKTIGNGGGGDVGDGFDHHTDAYEDNNNSLGAMPETVVDIDDGDDNDGDDGGGDDNGGVSPTQVDMDGGGVDEAVEAAKTDDDEECYVYDNPQVVTD